jgi:ribose transport system substrate-binding protein
MGLVKRKCLSTLSVTAGISMAAIGIGACGSSSSTSSSSSSVAASSSSSAGNPNGGSVPSLPYNGADAKYFGTVKPPRAKRGFKFTVGLLQNLGAQPVLNSWQVAAQKEITALGGKTIALDAELDAQKQLSQLQQLISQHVNAIIASPVDGASLNPGVKQAVAAHIPVFALDSPVDLSQPANPLYISNVTQAFDYSTYSLMKTMARMKSGATFAMMGSGVPAPILQYMPARTVYWGKKFGLKFVGQVNAATDNPQGYAPAAQAILTKWPNVREIYTYNDESALATVNALKAAGKTNIQVADPNDGQSIVKPALLNGSISAVYFTPWQQIGRIQADEVYDYLTKQNLPLPKTLAVRSSVITKANAAGFSYVG